MTFRNVDGAPRNGGKWGSAPLLRILVVTTSSGQRGYSGCTHTLRALLALMRQPRKGTGHLSSRGIQRPISERFIRTCSALIHHIDGIIPGYPGSLQHGQQHFVRLRTSLSSRTEACPPDPERASRRRLIRPFRLGTGVTSGPYLAVQPPSISIVCPVIRDAAGEARNTTAPATSMGSPMR